MRQNRSQLSENTALPYGFALLLGLFAAILTKWLSPIFSNTFFEFFHMAVVISAFYGGLGPGVLAATASFLIIDYYFVPPLNQFIMGPHLIRLFIFEAAAILTSLLSGKLKKRQREIEDARDKLEVRIAERTEELSEMNRKLLEEVAQRKEAEKAILEISTREQMRLGHELHDGVCQTLAGIRLVVEDMSEKSCDGATDHSKEFALIDSRLTEALAQADAVSRGFYPVELEKNGLMAALEELTEKISRVYPVECRFRCWEPIAITDIAVANHLYRIAQESILNGIKGGKAKRISVHLLRQANKIYLRVTDNGIGLQNSAKRNGMGMQIMTYRARVIGADLKFRSHARGGTMVSCALSTNGQLEDNHGK